MLLAEIGWQQKPGKEVVFRADAAIAKPEIYEALEERGVKYAIRIAFNDSPEPDITELLTLPAGRPSRCHEKRKWFQVIFRPASPTAGMHGTELCDRERRTFRLSAPR